MVKSGKQRDRAKQAAFGVEVLLLNLFLLEKKSGEPGQGMVQCWFYE